MCGIVGVIKLPEAKTKLVGEKKYSVSGYKSAKSLADIISDLALMANARGGDNHGIMIQGTKPWAAISKDSRGKKLRLHRADGPFKTYSSTLGHYLDSAVQEGGATFIHTRKSSSGGKSVAMAHPIMESPIVMMHNGTLTGDWRKHVNASVESDTKAITTLVGERGIKWVYENLTGPMTMVWYDENDESINLIRHEDRPLYRIVVENHMFFASEAWMLYAALDVNGIDVDSLPELLPLNTHIKFIDGVEHVVGVYSPKPDELLNNYHSGYRGSNVKPLKKKAITSTVIDNSDVRIGDLVLFRPYVYKVYDSKKDDSKCVVYGYYDIDSSIAPKTDFAAVDVALHGIPKVLANQLVRTNLVFMAKVVGKHTVVNSLSPEYSEGFTVDYRTLIPAYAYCPAGEAGATDYKEFMQMCDLISNHLHRQAVGLDSVRVNLPEKKEVKIVDAFNAAKDYAKKFVGKCETKEFPFKFEESVREYLPTGEMQLPMAELYNFNQRGNI